MPFFFYLLPSCYFWCNGWRPSSHIEPWGGFGPCSMEQQVWNPSAWHHAVTTLDLHWFPLDFLLLERKMHFRVFKLLFCGLPKINMNKILYSLHKKPLKHFQITSKAYRIKPCNSYPPKYIWMKLRWVLYNWVSHM